MNHKIFWLGVAIVIFLAIAFGWSKSDNTPSITMISPSGGEIWQPGEERQISWKTEGIKKTDKISVTIRRIPPPPIREEGQEFDPIIFTDLPNTGSAKWKISPMYPDGTYVLELHSYASLPMTDNPSVESKNFSITHPKLHADLSPLYRDAQWKATEVEQFVIGTANYSGTSISSYPMDAGMNPGSIISPFERYYDAKLKALGWRVANDLAAGGHVGGQTGYRKGDATILTRFKIDYHTEPENAPTECPCEVTLSLFSTN